MKKLIPFAALGLLGVIATSCGGSTVYEKGVDINYALLIGQIDHNDSAARTAGIRDALGTRGEKMTNANMETPVQGELTINGKKYRINEVEHAEQKATGGATWDAATATATTEAWLNKHANDKWSTSEGEVTGQGINFFVSNNDGMAEGATSATNWVDGMPIFGYDSNETTLVKIKQGLIMGTINQNAPAQAAGILMVARNAADGKTGKDVYTSGFGKNNANDYGYVEKEFAYNAETKAFLVNNAKVDSSNIDDYVDESGKAIPVTDQLEPIKEYKGGENINVFLDYYSASDTFLNSSMKPLFRAYAQKMNITLNDSTAGDGNDEKQVTDKLKATKEGEFDAYCINMVKTTSTAEYLDIIAGKTGATEDKPTSVPVIFWNRQGTKADGSVDSEVMKDKRFTNIYYVGFDANQGGQLQGEMIVDYLEAHIDEIVK